jgi:hypothetical protein
MTSREIAQALRSAASAIEHGRSVTFRKKLVAVAKDVNLWPGDGDSSVFARVATAAVKESRAKQLPSTQVLSDELRNLIDAAKLIIERWGSGDLADAVNGLRIDGKHAESLLGDEKEWPGD